MERRDTPGVSLLRKRKRKDLSVQEMYDVMEEYIGRKRARRAVASKFNISEQLVSDLAREHRKDPDSLTKPKARETESLLDVEAIIAAT